MTENNGFTERMAELITDISPKILSERTGINTSMLHRYKKGTDAGSSAIIKILEASGYSGLWLFHGVGPKLVSEVGSVEAEHIEVESLTDTKGGDVTFDPDYLRNFLKVEPENTRHLSVRDDCMAPDYNENDLVLVDISRKTGQGVFVINMAGEPSLRQAKVQLNGNIELKCSNPKYDSHEVSQEEFENLNIMGRVVWTGGKA